MGMDATYQPRHFSSELYAYAENKKIFEIFQNILESLCVDRPEDPLEYLYDLLTKDGVFNVPKVYLLGPSSIDRTLVCFALSLKLGLTHITVQSLMEMEDSVKPLSTPDWINIVKRRTEMPDCVRNGWILEGMPRSRNEAFLLRKKGIFPSHIVLFEPRDPSDMSLNEMSEEMQDYLANKSLILDFHRESYVKAFIVDSDVDATIRKVLDFVRSRMHPRVPYLPRVLLLGTYGSGRRSVAKKLAEKYNLVEVNYQEELRKAAMKDSPTKQKIGDVLKTSSPIPDDLLADIAVQKLLQKDCIESGWVMYNFPDTVAQAELLVKGLEGFQINRAVFLDANLQTCLFRVEPRRLDSVTGKQYHMKNNPCTQVDIIERLIQLPQDSVDSVKAEYALYSENVEHLKKFFSQELSDDIVVEVNADASEEDIFESVQGAVLQSSKMKCLL